MKLYCLSVVSKSENGTVCPLAAAYELSSFGYFQRSSVREFMDFSCKILVGRTMTSTRSSVKEQEYICHVYVRSDNLAGVVIADLEYPQRVAHTLLNKVLEEFSAQYKTSQWSSAKQGTVEFTQLETLLQKYQNPKEADATTRIQNDLDKAKIILHNAIEEILQKGEKLDALVDESEMLGIQSKALCKTNPKEVDAMTRIQNDLDETKFSLHNAVEDLLQKGEKLDDLVDESEMLDTESKAFYKTNPKEVDAMTRIQIDIDEIISLHNTIEDLLQKGEKLDDLVDESEMLGTESKAFYKTGKKTNQRCVIL